jgi:hypothetical protein
MSPCSSSGGMPSPCVTKPPATSILRAEPPGLTLSNVKTLVDELCRLSSEFEGMWRDNDVRTTYGEAAKHVRHPVAGLIGLEYSAFAVDGRPDLGMVIYNPATPADADRIRTLIKRK